MYSEQFFDEIFHTNNFEQHFHFLVNYNNNITLILDY